MKSNTVKYIRTKDGRIIELPKSPTLMKYDNTIIDLNAIRKGKVGHEIINALIDNQADTIEELCDEFVAFKTKEDYGILSATDYIEGHKWEMEDYAKNGYQIYACIWVIDSNGAPTLKPVARMNENGELVLL